jgi:phosphate transport system substrate-binding protein
MAMQRRAFVAGVIGVSGAGWSGIARAQLFDEFGAGQLRGAGSTFVHPLMAAWADEYRRYRRGPGAIAGAGSGLDSEIDGVALDYEAIGSQAGIQRVKMRAVDFAASEMPLPASDLDRSQMEQVPLVAGAVDVVVNLPGVTPPLRLAPEQIADIFTGRIRRWSDPQLAATNPGLALPNAEITVQHRQDGSGTTFAFASFLSATNARWQSELGADLQINWPVGRGHRGNTALARAVRATAHSIGYCSDVAAVQAGLQPVWVRNPAGQFVSPALANVQAALARADWNSPTRFNTRLVALPGDASYPIVAAVFGLYSRTLPAARQGRVREFLAWSLGRGQSTAQRLGYASLPDGVSQRLQRLLEAGTAARSG